ncbi:MAG: hypothetical protein JXX29_17190 [Deltaproteobacteria bacterium]|nr:hypothetical protein [Deltaproteobacteria bacterium]MBN2673422.1 hypothetical protein [Deltaproteobacteria bacterium]
MNTLRISTIIALCVFFNLGCKSATEPSSSQKNGNDFLKCADVAGDDNLEKISLPPLTLVRDDQDLKISGISSSIIAVGLLAGIHEMTPETEKNLNYYLDQFKAAKVQAIIVVGGVGKTQEQITNVLTALAKAPIPILVTPGSQASFGALRGAFKKLKQKYPQLVDLTQVRRVFMKHVNFISLPGYFNPFYLEARSQGCSYELKELQQITDLAMDDKTNVLLSATPPLGTGPNAPDMGRGNVNIGDPALRDELSDSPIKFALVGHVYESGGNAVAKGSTQSLPPGIWHPSIILQAGSADAIPVRLTNGGRTAGMAHIVDFSGHRARFKQILAK